MVLRHHGVYDTIRPYWSNDEQDWEKVYFREGEGQKRTHIHVRATGRANQRYALIFRDYLRTHPQIATHYAAMKYKMAAYFGSSTDRTLYVDSKDPMVDLIATLAKEWAEQTGWAVGEADL